MKKLPIILPVLLAIAGETYTMEKTEHAATQTDQQDEQSAASKLLPFIFLQYEDDTSFSIRSFFANMENPNNRIKDPYSKRLFHEMGLVDENGTIYEEVRKSVTEASEKETRISSTPRLIIKQKKCPTSKDLYTHC